MSRDSEGPVASASGDHLSSLQLDALALGAVDDVAAHRAQAHLAACGPCRRQADELRASRDHFTASVMARTLPAVRQRATPWAWWARRWTRQWTRTMAWIAAPVLAAAVALVMVRIGDREPARGDAIDDGLRVKGGPSLQVVARRGDRVGPVIDGATLAAGDQIRFVVGAPRAGYLLIASVDGSGATTVYYPYGGSHSARVEAGRSALAGSVVLDDAPGPERIVALWSAAPLAARDVTDRLAAIGARGADAIRSTADLDVDADSQRSVVFEKSPP